MYVDCFHILLPFGLPDVVNSSTALSYFTHPAFDRLIARSTCVERAIGEDMQRVLPHERWLIRQFGLGNDEEAPLAPYMLLADGGTPGITTWVCVEPVHIHIIAHDRLMLVEPTMLKLSDNDAATLYSVAKPIIEALGIHIEAPTARRWYFSSQMFGVFASVSPLRASGRNIEIWLPHVVCIDECSHNWMKLQNEIQMAWFGHPVNTAREAQGLLPINSIWFHAQGTVQSVKSPFAHVFSNAVVTRGITLAAQKSFAAVPATFCTLAATLNDSMLSTTLVEIDALSMPFIEQDWARWNTAFAELEHNWFAPILTALQKRELKRAAFTLCGNEGFVTLIITCTDLHKFWRHRTFVSLFIE